MLGSSPTLRPDARDSYGRLFPCTLAQALHSAGSLHLQPPRTTATKAKPPPPLACPRSLPRPGVPQCSPARGWRWGDPARDRLPALPCLVTRGESFRRQPSPLSRLSPSLSPGSPGSCWRGSSPLIPLWIQKSPSPRAPSVTAFAFPGTLASIATLPQGLPRPLWGCLLTLLIPCPPLSPAFLTASSWDLALLLCLAPWNLPPTHHSSVFAWVWVRSAQGLPLVTCLC